MSKLILLAGIPGSGKSTFAKRLSSEVSAIVKDLNDNWNGSFNLSQIGDFTSTISSVDKQK